MKTLSFRPAVSLLALLVLITGTFPAAAYPGMVAPPTTLDSALLSGAEQAAIDTVWNIETVDSVDTVGWDSSIALDVAGRPHISYCRPDIFPVGPFCHDLKYGWYNGSGWTIQTVDVEHVGAENSLALDSSGLPHIAYGRYICGGTCTSVELRYASYDGAAWQIQIVESENYVGNYTSLAIDHLDRPHISHIDEGTAVKYTYWDGANWQNQVVDTAYYGSAFTSLVLDDQDHPHLVYQSKEGIDLKLKYAWYDGTAWQIEVVETDGSGGYPSLALDAQGRPHISYFSGNWLELRHAWRGDLGWNVEVIDSGLSSSIDQGSSLVIDSKNRPRIAYHVGYPAEELRYAWYDGISWRLEDIDSNGSVGNDPSLVLDSLDQPHVSYFDATNGDLKYAMAPCVPVATLSITGPRRLPTGITGLYTSTYTPLEPTFPDLVWGNSQVGPTAPYSWTLPGSYTVTVTATNPCSQLSTSLTVTAFCQAPQDATAEGPHSLLAGFSGNYLGVVRPITASPPVTFTWDTGRVGPAQVYSWTVPGVYTPAITVSNQCGQAQGHFTVTVLCLPVLEDDFSWQPMTPTVGQSVTLTAEAVGTGPGWLTETIDVFASQRAYPSLVIDGAGSPHISYGDAPAGALDYARLDNTGWHTETVDSGLLFDWDTVTSLALDANGLPRISYYDAGNADLKYVSYDGTSWLTETVDSVGEVGNWNSLVLDNAGYPHISYEADGHLKYAWFDGASWQKQVVDTEENGAIYTSLVLDNAGYPHISYYASSYHTIKYAWYDGSVWHLESVFWKIGYAMNDTSLVLDRAGYPHIGCWENDMYSVKPSELIHLWLDGGAWYTETVESALGFGSYAALALDGQDRPRFGYSVQECDGSGCYNYRLRYAYRDEEGWHIEKVDNVGQSVSLALDRQGRPHLAYTRDGLTYARLEEAPPTPPISYTWALGDGSFVAGSVVQHNYALPGLYTVTLTTTNCQGEGTAVATQTITVSGTWPCSPVEGADFTWQPLTPTIGQPVTLTATASGTLPISFTWNLDDGAFGIGLSLTHTYTQPGLYTVTMTAANCTTATASVVHHLTVTVAPTTCEPARDILFVWDPLTPTTGQPMTLTAWASGTLPITFSWELSGEIIGYGVTLIYTFTVPGSYSITLTASNSCSIDTISFPVVVIRELWQVYLPLVTMGPNGHRF